MIIDNLVRLVIRGKFAYLYAGARRRYLYYFHRGYVLKQLTLRKGACNQRGDCCRLTLPWCKHLTKDGKCAAYQKQPLFCKLFPIDEKDQKLSGVGTRCAYFFKRH
ncbi:MAG: hypothetical protein KBA46_04315 [Candidatus Omnitrophica bacterium]|nr:hypothetical protein [Candidatus Omnitrophota bacterium]